MLGNTHAAIGLMTGAAVAVHFGIAPGAESVGILALAAFGSLLPDIDHPNSFISNRVKILAVPFRLLSHRGLTHSLLALVVLAALLSAFRVEFIHSAAFLAGYTSHLLADALTRSGIRFWYPLQQRFWLLPAAWAVDTGGTFDSLIAIVSLFATVYMMNNL